MTPRPTIDPMRVWAGMRMKLWPERYVMLHVDAGDAGHVAEAMRGSPGTYACMIVDQGGVSATVDERCAAAIEARCATKGRFGPFRVVSTDGPLPFDVVGFLRPLLEVLNGNGIKAGPQCGADFDHLFIYEDSIDAAMRLIDGFIASAREAAGT